MGKKGKKGKGGDPVEPPHDPGWERAVESGKWDRPPEALPDANLWPTWGALRERVITSCKEVKVTWSPSLRDAFPAELIKLSPPELTTLDLHGSELMTRFVMSPLGTCPKLAELDLSSCKQLEYILVQSESIEKLTFNRCPNLKKAFVQCKNMRELACEGCEKLERIIVWSEQLMELDISTCTELQVAELYCPELYNPVLPPNGLKKKAGLVPPKQPPINSMLREDYRLAAQKEEDMKEAERALSVGGTLIPKPYHALKADFNSSTLARS